MVGVGNFAQQLFGKRQDFGQSSEFVVLREASGLLAEVMKLDFQRECVSLEAGSLKPVDKFGCHVVQFDDDGRLSRDVFFQRAFATDRFAYAHRFDRARVNASCEVIIKRPGFTEQAGQHVERAVAQLFAVVNPQQMHLLCGDRPDAPKGFDGQLIDKVFGLRRMDGAKPVRFSIVGSNFS